MTEGSVKNGNIERINDEKPPNLLHDLIDWNPTDSYKSHPPFFWRSHTISVLLALILVLGYVTFIEEDQNSTPEYNAKRGVIACFVVFIAFGITQAKDGPFLRPHPVIWRFVLCCSIIYELCLIFLLFQTIDDARRWMSHIDPELGSKLAEQDYGGSCLIYDSNNTDDPWHNVKDKLDIFVTGHFVGWWVKTIILRDYWMAIVLSFLFELLEYTLQHQLPNFSECWWDHWLMDFVICNGGGIFLGMITLQYLECKQYNWRNLWSIPTIGGKCQRFLQQFTPYSWHKFNWSANGSLRRWLWVVILIAMFAMSELNVFYMKAALWIPSAHPIIQARLILYAFMGSVACRELYDYLNDSSCDKFGQQLWVVSIISITEALIAVKFLWKIVIKLPSLSIIIAWCCFFTYLFLYTCWLAVSNFFAANKASIDGEFKKSN